MTIFFFGEGRGAFIGFNTLSLLLRGGEVLGEFQLSEHMSLGLSLEYSKAVTYRDKGEHEVVLIYEGVSPFTRYYFSSFNLLGFFLGGSLKGNRLSFELSQEGQSKRQTYPYLSFTVDSGYRILITDQFYATIFIGIGLKPSSIMPTEEQIKSFFGSIEAYNSRYLSRLGTNGIVEVNYGLVMEYSF